MKFLIPICFGLILLGCDKPLSRQEVAGLYTADFGAGRDTIELRPDGTYFISSVNRARQKRSKTRVPGE